MEVSHHYPSRHGLMLTLMLTLTLTLTSTEAGPGPESVGNGLCNRLPQWFLPYDEVRDDNEHNTNPNLDHEGP